MKSPSTLQVRGGRDAVVDVAAIVLDPRLGVSAGSAREAALEYCARHACDIRWKFNGEEHFVLHSNLLAAIDVCEPKGESQ